MLKSLADKTTRDIYDGISSRQARKLPRELHDKARRLLDQVNAAPTLDMLRIPPSNRLEKLKGDSGVCGSMTNGVLFFDGKAKMHWMCR